MLSAMHPSDEPLEISAPLAWQLAAQLCRRDPITGEDCAWTHSIWQYLRLLRQIGAIENHSAFYRQALEPIAHAGNAPRILLSGVADYGMLARVTAAFRGSAVPPRITVVDLCETPLALNRWYAQRIGCQLETHCGDILEYAGAGYDAVCTDSFLGRFAPGRRLALTAKWHDLLRPDGLAITVNHLRPEAGAEPVRFSAEQARSFRDAVLGAAEAMRSSLTMEPSELAQRAEIYAARHFTHPLRSTAELRVLFEGCGFEVDHLSVVAVAAEKPRNESGPSRGGGNYARIIARRAT